MLQFIVRPILITRFSVLDEHLRYHSLEMILGPLRSESSTFYLELYNVNAMELKTVMVLSALKRLTHITIQKIPHSLIYSREDQRILRRLNEYRRKSFISY